MSSFLSSAGYKDLWLMNADSGEKTRLTYSHTPQTDLLSAGQPSFVSQEEFDRFTGYCYWWLGVFRILFEEVDERTTPVLKNWRAIVIL